MKIKPEFGAACVTFLFGSLVASVVSTILALVVGGIGWSFGAVFSKLTIWTFIVVFALIWASCLVASILVLFSAASQTERAKATEHNPPSTSPNSEARTSFSPNINFTLMVVGGAVCLIALIWAAGILPSSFSLRNKLVGQWTYWSRIPGNAFLVQHWTLKRNGTIESRLWKQKILGGHDEIDLATGDWKVEGNELVIHLNGSSKEGRTLISRITRDKFVVSSQFGETVWERFSFKEALNPGSLNSGSTDGPSESQRVEREIAILNRDYLGPEEVKESLLRLASLDRAEVIRQLKETWLQSANDASRKNSRYHLKLILGAFEKGETAADTARRYDDFNREQRASQR